MIFTITEITEKVVPIAKKYGVKQVILFGSYARKAATEESDIDLLIVKGKQLKNHRAYFAFYHELLDILQKNVDIVTTDGLTNGSRQFKQSVKEEGIMIYEDK